MVVLEDWIIPYGIPEVILMENGKQFTSKFFRWAVRISGHETDDKDEISSPAQRASRTV